MMESFIKTSVFEYSSPSVEKCRKTSLPEIAFIGRSNVGKSSLINMLTNCKGLAKTSQTPGKTKLINYFLINKSWYLVDLPGYGFARISKEERKKLENIINGYILKRKQLLHLFVLVDSRIEPQTSDVEFINNLGKAQIPFTILFTKADKLSKNQLAANRKKFEAALAEFWEELPPMITTSSLSRQGKEDIISFLKTILPQ